MNDLIGILIMISSLAVTIVALGALALVMTGGPLPAVLQPRKRTAKPAKSPTKATPVPIADGRDQSQVIDTTPITPAVPAEPVTSKPPTTTPDQR